ncbi:MAG: DUF5362 family protein [Acidobacteriota bacterium]
MEQDISERTQLVRTIGLPIHQSKGWLKLIGVLSIVYGALSALTIVGIIVAWLPIWLGVVLYQSATLIDQAYTSGDPQLLKGSLAKLKTYFTITGVVALLGLILVGVLLAFGLLGAIASMIGRL